MSQRCMSPVTGHRPRCFDSHYNEREGDFPRLLLDCAPCTDLRQGIAAHGNLQSKRGKAMDSITIDIPDHVPPELVRDDYPFIMGLTTVENPFDTMTRKIHQGPDIIYSTNAYPIGIPAWIPRRLEDLQAIYLDTEHFSSAGFSPYAMLVGESWNLVPAEIDPPGHTAYRALLTPLFTP